MFYVLECSGDTARVLGVCKTLADVCNLAEAEFVKGLKARRTKYVGGLMTLEPAPVLSDEDDPPEPIEVWANRPPQK